MVSSETWNHFLACQYHFFSVLEYSALTLVFAVDLANVMFF